MFRVSLKNVTGRFWTLVLTALAVVLGTAFVAGSLVFTDSIDRTFNQLFSSSTAGTDAVVRGTETVGSTGFGDGREQLPLDLATDLEAVDGVAAATPQIFGLALMVGEDGTAVRNGGAPSFALAYDPESETTSITEGRAPEGPDEIAPERSTLELSGLSVGDSSQLLAGNEPVDVTIVGVVDSEDASLGATSIYLDEATAESYFAPEGLVSTFSIRGDGSLSQQELADAIAPVLSDSAEVVTQDVLVEEGRETVGTALGFVNTFLLVVAFVSLLVGSFIIFNVFSMLLARRTRELALLRAVGASGGQVLLAVVVEALAVGLIGSVLGLGLGLLIAFALQSVVGGFGFEISGGLPVDAMTVGVTIAAGVVATVVSAMLPAIRASRVAPVAALRDDVALPERQIRIRALIGLVLAALGITALLLGLFTEVDRPLWWVGGGVLGVFFGVAIAAPLIARPVVWLISVPSVALAGTVGRLARQNSLRNPRRTAATASALMIGTALVGAATIVTSSINASLADTIENDLTAEYVLSSGQTAFFPTSVAADAAELDGVALALPTRSLLLELDGGPPATGTAAAEEAPESLFVLAGSLAQTSEAVDITLVSGDATASDEDSLAIARSTAEDRGWSVGDVVTARPGVAEPRDLTVTAIFEDSSIIQAEGLVSASLYDEAVPAGQQVDNQVLVVAQDGADLAALREDLTALVQPYLVVSVLNGEEFTSQFTNGVNQVLGIISALLGLSIFVALIGIVITLVLSVIERRREIGLLRAVGLTRMQLRRTVTLEGVATSVFGALLGITLGIVFGLSLQRALSEQGLETLSVPYVTLAVFLVVGAVVGVLASAAPAWWASRRDILESIATE